VEVLKEEIRVRIRDGRRRNILTNLVGKIGVEIFPRRNSF